MEIFYLRIYYGMALMLYKQKDKNGTVQAHPCLKAGAIFVY